MRDPDGALRVDVDFAADPSDALARIRVRDAEAPLAPSGGRTWRATVDTRAIASGPVRVELVQRLRGGDVTTFAAETTLSHAAYVVWTLDHEGYDEPDELAASVAAVAAAGIPLSLLFHPRTLVPGALPDARRLAITRWAEDRASRGDEVGMHLHLQFDFVRDAGVAPRTAPRWGIGVGGDGYDVPLTAYEEDEQRRLVERGLALMAQAGLPRPSSFRAGGQFADARTLRALAAARFTADTSAHDAGTIGALRMPWTIGIQTPPYRPSASDANAADAHGLPLLEVPNTAGNTYSDGLAELRRRQGLLWGGGIVATPIVLDYVSHPSTFVAAERAKVETAFAPLLDARADRDAGPVRFVRLADLVGLWSS